MKEELVKEEKKEVNEMNAVEKDKKALEEEKKEKRTCPQLGKKTWP